MEISLKNLVLAGIGTIACSYEKASELVDDLVKKGELTLNQGKELNEELKRKISDSKGSNISTQLTFEDVKDFIASLNLATKSDLEELKERLSKLENR